MYIAYPVHAVIGEPVVLIIVADEVVLSVLRRHLIGAHDILTDAAVPAALSVLLLVRAVFEIGKGHLPPGGDRLVQYLDGIEKLWIARQRLRHGVDVLHVGLKIPAGQAFKLFHKLLALVVGQMLRKQQAVDQQPQLAFRELPLQIQAGHYRVLFQLACLRVRRHADGLGIFDRIAHVHEVSDVAADGLAVGGHVVFGFQDIHNVPLAEPVIRIGILLQDIQDQHGKKLFGRLCHHTSSPLWILSHPASLYNT